MGEGGDERVDVLVIGAGISGIDAAYHLQTYCPGRTYAILEGRERLGGTWDLFRYPGVRSDSDMHTLGFGFKPWKADKAIADGPSILAYLHETVDEHGIGPHIRYRHVARRASWSSADAEWTVEVDHDGTTRTFRCRFLFVCAGYYSYRGGYAAEIPGIDRFAGRVVHPQAWPDDLELTGRRVVVIGSGATAVTLVPAIAGDAAHVTMLQRSPTYVVSRPERDAIANGLRTRPPGADGVRHHPAQEHRHAAVHLPAITGRPGEDEGPAAGAGPQAARPGLRRRDPLHPVVRPVGSAPVPRARRRSLRRHPRRLGIRRDRPHPHGHRARHRARVRRHPRCRRDRHRHRPADGHARRDGRSPSTASRSTSPSASCTRASPTPTSPTWRRRSATSTRRGRCAPISRAASSPGSSTTWTRRRPRSARRACDQPTETWRGARSSRCSRRATCSGSCTCSRSRAIGTPGATRSATTTIGPCCSPPPSRTACCSSPGRKPRTFRVDANLVGASAER